MAATEPFMSYISLPDDDASPELSRVVKGLLSPDGTLANILGSMKHNPKALRAVMQMNNAVTFGGSTLGRQTEEFIATVISSFAHCFY